MSELNSASDASDKPEETINNITNITSDIVINGAETEQRVNNGTENNSNSENENAHLYNVSDDDKLSVINVDNQAVVTNITHEDAHQNLQTILKTVEDVVNVKHVEEHVNDTYAKSDKSGNTVLEESNNSTTAQQV